MSNIFSGLLSSRTFIEEVNAGKTKIHLDFAFGIYLANKNFFDELSRIQASLIDKGTVVLNTGQTANLSDIGGIQALQLYLTAIEAAKDAMEGLAKLGLKNENRLWQLQN